MEYATTTDPDTGTPSVEFVCPACGKAQRRPLSTAGDPSACTECGATFRVPGAADRERAEARAKRARESSQTPERPTQKAPRLWPVTFTIVGTFFRIVGLLLVWNALTAGNGPTFGSTVNLGMMNDRLVEAVIGGAFLVCGALEAVGARVVKGMATGTHSRN